MVLAHKVKACDVGVEGEAEAEADTCAESGWYCADVPLWTSMGDAKDADEGERYEYMLSSMVSESSEPCWCC